MSDSGTIYHITDLSIGGLTTEKFSLNITGGLHDIPDMMTNDKKHLLPKKLLEEQVLMLV